MSHVTALINAPRWCNSQSKSLDSGAGSCWCPAETLVQGVKSFVLTITNLCCMLDKRVRTRRVPEQTQFKRQYRNRSGPATPAPSPRGDRVQVREGAWSDGVLLIPPLGCSSLLSVSVSSLQHLRLFASYSHSGGFGHLRVFP